MPTTELNDDEQATVDDAFDDFDLSEAEVEEAVDGADDDEIDTGGEALDDDAAAGEGEGEAQPEGDQGEGAEARTDAGPKGDKVRDKSTGKFVKKGEPKPGEKRGAGAAAKPGEAEAAAAAAAPKWEKLAVSVDKALYPIDEAVVTKHGDHMMIAVKATDFPRFQQRMQRGVVADRMWRQINDAVNEIEEKRALEKDAPQPKGDKEIEAEVILEYLNEKDPTTGQTLLSQIADPKDLKWLADRVKRRQLEHKDEFAKTRGEFVTKRQEERAAQAETAGEGEVQLRGMAKVLMDMTSEEGGYPAEVVAVFKDATPDELKKIYGALVPLRRSLYWKEGKEWYADTQLMLNTAKQELAKIRQSATPGKPGTPAAKVDPKTARAERLNKGQETQSTSLKNKRAPLRPSDSSGHPRKPAPASEKTAHTRARDAEDTYRKKTRDYLNSDGFDLPDDDED